MERLSHQASAKNKAAADESNQVGSHGFTERAKTSLAVSGAGRASSAEK